MGFLKRRRDGEKVCHGLYRLGRQWDDVVRMFCRSCVYASFRYVTQETRTACFGREDLGLGWNVSCVVAGAVRLLDWNAHD